MTATPAIDPVVTPLDDRVGLGGLAVPSSQPYPWPYDGAAVAERTALVVVAAQMGLVPLCATASESLAVIESLTAAVRGWEGTVVATRHAASPALRRPGILSPAGSDPWALVDSLAADVVIDAYGLDGFSGSPLADYLVGAGIDHLLLCGLGMEGPVHSTMRSANDRGLECLLVIDGCAPLDATLAEAAVRIIEMSGGIFGAVASSDAVLSSFPILGG